MPRGGRGNERKVGKWWRSPWSVACACAGGGFDTLVAAAALVVSGNSEEIFLPVSDEMRSGFQLISPSKVQTFVRRGSGCVACVAARPLVCLQLRCAPGRRHSPRRTCGDQLLNLGPNRKGSNWTNPQPCQLRTAT
ncbi:hypothetical protein PVAP13_4KG062933 [Panicum virgatum]|uniref:Uncharacterized protein n=1 Tax=Panicum virgatum TaxID=38727 RepID=A0A8T0TL97_PANVG|nr:hypothetical protein PVAP13_4KG062933 [Panicum virgatum]